MPFPKSNSRIVAAFCSDESSRSFDRPARPLSAMPSRHTATPQRITRPEVLAAICAELTGDDRRDERAECGTKAERYCDAERNPEISHRQPESQTAKSPQHAKDIRPGERGRGRRRQRGSKIRDQKPREQPGRDDPAEDAADEPIGLPRPATDTAIGNVEAGRGQTANPVIEHSEHRIRAHAFVAPGARVRDPQHTLMASICSSAAILSSVPVTCPTPTAQWCAGP